jgi:hypothetical protein
MKMGRPPKAPEERRDADIKIPLTDAEKEELWAAAQQLDTKPITWCRETLLKAARRTKAKQ